MILADASVWIDHIRKSNPALSDLLERWRLMGHPMVAGEVALGSLRDRAETIRRISQLPPAIVARHGDVMTLIESEELFATGIGYVDAHLVASAQLTPQCFLWTRDKWLRAVAERLRVYRSPLERGDP